jgi:hypothetical protein
MDVCWAQVDPHHADVYVFGCVPELDDLCSTRSNVFVDLTLCLIDIPVSPSGDLISKMPQPRESS